MSRTCLVLAALLAAASANPFYTYMISEIQVAPDSEQRLEVTCRYWPGYPIDLSGWSIATRNGTAYVNPGVTIPDTDTYVVLDRLNTSGTLRFGDSDEVLLSDSWGNAIDRLGYPRDPDDGSGCFKPPSGMSGAAHYYYAGWPDEYLARLWYVDSVPTFGQPNPDSAGCISGTIRDQNSNPISGASVWADGPEGRKSGGTGADGGYFMAWLGPGTFRIGASRGGYTGFFPDSVRLGSYEHRTGVDIVVPGVGIPERPPAQVVSFGPSGPTLDISVASAGQAEVKTISVLGRVCREERIALSPGRNRVPLRDGLAAGVYVARVVVEGKETSRKFVVY